MLRRPVRYSPGGGLPREDDPMTDDLAQFLRDRLDDDTRAIKGLWNPPGASHQLVTMQGTTVLMRPARALAEIEAKRQIVEQHKPAKPSYLPNRERGCLTCSTAQVWDAKANEANCQTLRLLALPFADHTDYRNEWRP